MKNMLLLLLLSFSFSAVAQINMSQGLQLYLPFNGNAQDASGNGNNGIVNGATLTQDQLGNPNSAYFFDGVNDEITVPNNPTLNNNTMSVCAKVKMQGFYNGFCYNNVILNKGADHASSPTVNHFSLRTTATNTNGDCNFQDTSNHNYRFDINDNGTLTMATLNTTPHIVTNNWDCLVGTYDGSTHKLYVNGVLRYQNAVPSKPHNLNDLTIGWYKENSLYPFWFNGVVDEIRIYNRIINSDEINYYCSIPFPESVNNLTKEIDIPIGPNPGSNSVNLDFSNLIGKATLSITSVDGNIILSKDVIGKTQEKIEISTFANGLYFFNIRGAKQNKVIKFFKN